MVRSVPALRLAALFAALALLLRVALPAGWMPAAGWTITLCTAAGPATIALDKDGQPVKPAASGHCAFAGVAPALPAPDLPIAAPLLLALALLLAAVTPTAPRRAARTRLRPPLRAPPFPA